MTREPTATPSRRTSADGYFAELDIARRALASELERDQWAVIRSARLSANRDEHHDNLDFAIEAEGLETVTAAVAWGWRQAAEGARAVKYQCGTFSKTGQGWTHLLADYRASIEQAKVAEERKANPPEPVELERTAEQIAANEAIIAKLVPKFLRGAQ